MIPEKVCIKFTEEIINEFRLPRTTCYSFIKLRMERAYGAGYDKGRTKGGTPKQIVQVTKDGRAIQVWENISIAGKALEIDRSHITACAKGHRKTAGGFKWKYGINPKPEFKLF